MQVNCAHTELVDANRNDFNSRHYLGCPGVAIYKTSKTEAFMQIKEIPGWPNYLASEDGRILSRATGLPVREIQRKDGYINVHLFSHKDETGKKVYRLQLAHRLVCKAFYGDSKLEVNHIDGRKANNCASNLEWTTKSGNIRHSIDVLGNDHAGRGFDANTSKLTREDHDRIVRWNKSKVLDASEMAKFFGVHKETIMAHLRNSKRYAKRLMNEDPMRL